MVTCYTVYHISRQNTRRRDVFCISGTLHIDAALGGSPQFTTSHCLNFQSRLDAHIVIARDQAIHFASTVMPNHGMTVRLHLVKLFDGTLQPIGKGDQCIAWHAPQRGRNALCRVVHHPNVNQADDHVGPKVAGVRADDIVAVGVFKLGVDAEAIPIPNATLKAIPGMDCKVFTSIYFGQCRKPWCQTFPLYTIT